MGFLIVLSLLIEVAVLFYLEKKAWHTLYTPLNFLMLPYVVVLLMTLCVAGGEMGFVEFYYPSILLWNVGLLIFAFPSFILGFVTQKHHLPVNSTVSDEEMPRPLVWLAFFVVLLFLWRIKSTIGSSREMIGSDDFGEDFCGHGFWAHLRQLATPLLIMSIYFVSKRRWWLWIVILAVLTVNFLHQVKGWVIIPCVSGVAMRLYTGKMKLDARLILTVILSAFGVFLLSYTLSVVVAGEGEMDNVFINFLLGHFFHYLTSGTLGLSVDAFNGFPDGDGLQVILASFVNLSNMLVGNDEIVSPINPLFYNTGLNITNVRTFFGTLFINTNYLQFAAYTFVTSSILYFLKLLMVRFNSIYVFVIYFFECGMLCMGWFDFYYSHLDVIELPVLTLLMMTALWMIEKKPARSVALDTQ